MNGSTRYRLLRRVLQAWLAVSGRSVRALGLGRLPKSSAILYLCHPCGYGYLDALAIVAACHRPITLITDCEPSRLQSPLASGLSVISCRREPQARHLALRACTEALLSGRLLLAFGGRQDDRLRGYGADTALALAREAWASAFPEKPPHVLPVHRFYPSTSGQDILIHIGDRFAAEDSAAAQLIGPGSRACATPREVCGNSVFALEDSLLEELFGDLQHALQDRLRASWQARLSWNQSVDGFRLSSPITEALRRVNQCEPETLVALRQLSESAWEARRQSSLARLRGELGSKQVPILKRLLRLTESVLGLPLACWGLLNHLIPAGMLSLLGLAKRDQEAKPETWLGRAIVVLACYVGQIALVNRVADRATAGYYALTLPVSGAYLFRYRWLLHQRASISFPGLKAFPPRRGATASSKRLFEKLDQILALAGMTPPVSLR